MNENIDLTKILKDCPKGFKLYSLLHGEVSFRGIDETSDYPITYDYLIMGYIGESTSEFYLTRNGTYSNNYNGECILFPSKDQRDWSKFTAPWNEKKINSMSNKDNERLRKTTIAFLKDFAEQGYENAVECIDWLEKQREQEEYKFMVIDKLVKDKFDPKTLKSFDKVLVRNDSNCCWYIEFFSHYIKNNMYPYKCVFGNYKLCIPYNDDTKHLVGTTEEAPKYYRYWEN